MINFRLIALVTGLFLTKLSLLMLVPAAVGFGDQSEWSFTFLRSAGITFVAAILLLRWSGDVRRRLDQITMRVRDMFVITNAVWLMVSAFAALPLMFIPEVDYTDAFFETMSGITTTGSTVLAGLDQMPKSVLLWRSLLQWVGGIGFIVVGVAILPFLNVGGMKLFRTESSDWSDKPVAQTAAFTQYLLRIYVMVTVAGVAAYWLTGMNLFDAVNHAMTSVATGGYSTSDNSIGNFPPATHWVAALFMFIGGMPFTLLVRLLTNRDWRALRDEQFVGYFQFILYASIILALWLSLTRGDYWLDAFRLALVNVISVVTTTGYALTDYSVWGGFAVSLFFFLTFVGGCSGSTAGGLKIFRFQVALRVVSQHLKQSIHPAGVFSRRYNGNAISDSVINSMIVLFILFMMTWTVMTVCLALIGLDFVTAATGALTAICNVGPGLGPTIGPAGNFSSLPDAAKWILSIGMLLGRLEVTTCIVLLLPRFWRQ
ncbi:MAG: TrkH family potassium uptake protein [Gammaproteobacteria bacterium]|nr:TrkH family potassium uptake protein [Gammaproteobacteria bacterium]